MALYSAPTTNFISTTLNGSINDTVDSIILNDASTLPTSGYIIIDREDGNGTATASAREVVSYTGKTSNTLTGCTRGADESTARSHADGALVEPILTVGMWNGVITNLNTAIKVVGIQVVDAATSTATGDTKAFFRIPLELNGMNLVRVAATVYTAGTTNTTDVQIRNKTDTADMLSTKLTIDTGETDSSTAATPAVIDTTKDDVVTGDVLAIDVDAVSTTAAKGLYVELGFQLP